MAHAASILEITACAEKGHRLDFRIYGPLNQANQTGAWAVAFSENDQMEGCRPFYKTCKCGKRYQWGTPGKEVRQFNSDGTASSLIEG